MNQKNDSHKATFVNVGHGEFIAIEPGFNQMIIRDFGRSRHAQDTAFSCSPSSFCCPSNVKHRPDIFQSSCLNSSGRSMAQRCRVFSDDFDRLAGKHQVDAILSHAHEDHFNGFQFLYEDHRLRKIFQNGYVPLFQMEDRNALGALLIKYSIFQYRYFGSSGKPGRNAKHWLLAAPIMAGLSENLWCVTQGFSSDEWDIENRFLWPPVDPKETVDMLKSQWKRFLHYNGLDENFLMDEAEQIRQILSKYYREEETFFQMGGESETRTTGHSFDSEEVERDIEIITGVLGDPFDLESKRSFEKVQQLSRTSKSSIDDHSIIFELGEKKKSLFLSDAKNATVGKMLSANRINNCTYKLIKAGHHGNEGAKPLIRNGITSDKVVNPCGPAHSAYRGPDNQYKRISNNLICTSWNYDSPKWNNMQDFQIIQDCKVTIQV